VTDPDEDVLVEKDDDWEKDDDDWEVDYAKLITNNQEPLKTKYDDIITKVHQLIPLYCKDNVRIIIFYMTYESVENRVRQNCRNLKIAITPNCRK
jgi:hypothetical protein